tara:strand:- start:846 stop:947 length:102 start_codon:yes stop_codon:yes gene_type:complete
LSAEDAWRKYLEIEKIYLMHLQEELLKAAVGKK